MDRDLLARLVSVVIPVFEGKPFLGEAIESVLDQTYRPVEVIVVDDGSSDGSAAVARAFPDVRLILQEHAGPGAARNRGIAAASGQFLAFLDADDLMPADKLKRQVGYLVEHPAVGCVLGRQELFWEPGVARAAAPLAPPMWRHPELAARGSLQPLSLVARRSVFNTVGPFNAGFGEDIDWLCRVWDCGVQVDLIEEVVVRRRVHERNLTHNIGSSRLAMFKALKDHAERSRRDSAVSRFGE